MLSIATLLALSAAVGPADAADASEFLSGGTPTFLVGTSGDDAADRGIRRQVEFVQGLLFPGAKILSDVEVDVTNGVDAWPARPVVYGGAHLHAGMAALQHCLPLVVESGRIEVGGNVYEGDEYRLIALVPAQPETDTCPGSPQFLWYAGAGTPGVTEINATPDGGFGWVVIDRFGMRDAGSWERVDGRWRARLDHRSLRRPWRSASLDAAGAALTPGSETPVAVRVHRMESAAGTEADTAQNAAVARGVAKALSQLGLAQAEPLDVYLYPSAAVKASITRAGDGHADVASRSLHALLVDPRPGGPLESLVAHEAVHVLATDAFGVPGSALWGEGLAVWASGQYGGRALEAWRLSPPKLELGVTAFAGTAFFRHPERVTYPLAGLLVGDIVREHGLDAFLEHLYPAGPDDLEAACKALSTDVASLNAKLRRYRDG